MSGYEAYWAQREYERDMEEDRECPECKDVREHERSVIDQVAKSTKALIEQLYSKDGAVNYYALQTAIDGLVGLVDSYSNHEIELPEHVPLICRMSPESQEVWVTPVSFEKISNLK